MNFKDLLGRLDLVAVLGFLIAVETQISNGSMSFAHSLPEAWIPVVKEWAANLASVGGLLVGIIRMSSGGASATSTVVKVLIVAFLLSLFLGAPSAQAQIKLKTPQQVIDDLKGANQQVKSAVTGQPAPSSDAPLPCTFQMLTKLTPGNLLNTINQCIAGKLVADTQRALSSAQTYGTTGKGDADAVNCLTPALAIFQAGVEIPAVPGQDAVLNSDGSIKAPAVAATPAQEPGPILLYQKYREFTLSGALTACQSWFNGPINATAAAGLGAASTAIGAAAILAPIK